MNPSEIHDLTQRRAIVRLPSGKSGVRVSLRYAPRIELRNPRERLVQLRRTFRRLALFVVCEGGGVRPETLLVARQCCQGILPLARYEDLKRMLAKRLVRVEPLFEGDLD